MVKKILSAILLIFSTITAVQAFEDCIITSDGKLTDIKIEDNTIVDICPLVTIMNEKNTLILHPMKIGQTKVCVLKNDKEIIDFDVDVRENETIIKEVDGLEILTLDEPETPFELDAPPMFKEEGSNG